MFSALILQFYYYDVFIDPNGTNTLQPACLLAMFKLNNVQLHNTDALHKGGYNRLVHVDYRVADGFLFYFH